MEVLKLNHSKLSRRRRGLRETGRKSSLSHLCLAKSALKFSISLRIDNWTTTLLSLKACKSPWIGRVTKKSSMVQVAPCAAHRKQANNRVWLTLWSLQINRTCTRHRKSEGSCLVARWKVGQARCYHLNRSVEKDPPLKNPQPTTKETYPITNQDWWHTARKAHSLST